MCSHVGEHAMGSQVLHVQKESQASELAPAVLLYLSVLGYTCMHCVGWPFSTHNCTTGIEVASASHCLHCFHVLKLPHRAGLGSVAKIMHRHISNKTLQQSQQQLHGRVLRT